jgi:uncharacterized protein YbbC (DUF1343 family)
MLEYSTDYSVGRGTDAPFEMIGAEFISGRELAAYMNARWIPGVRFYPVRFQPSSANLAGREVEGIRFVVTNRESFDSSRLGFEIASALLKLYPGKISLETNGKLIGNQQVMQALVAGEDPETIRQEQQDALEGFLRLREKYQLYR